MKVNFHQKFYYIDNILFYEENSNDNLSSYKWVIPLYVISIDKIWNGKEKFHLSPVDFSNENPGSDIEKNYKWMLQFSYEDIGNIIFTSKKDAIKKYNDIFSEDEKYENEFLFLKHMEKNKDYKSIRDYKLDKLLKL